MGVVKAEKKAIVSKKRYCAYDPKGWYTPEHGDKTHHNESSEAPALKNFACMTWNGP